MLLVNLISRNRRQFSFILLVVHDHILVIKKFPVYKLTFLAYPVLFYWYNSVAAKNPHYIKVHLTSNEQVAEQCKLVVKSRIYSRGQPDIRFVISIVAAFPKSKLAKVT